MKNEACCLHVEGTEVLLHSQDGSCTFLFMNGNYLHAYMAPTVTAVRTQNLTGYEDILTVQPTVTAIHIYCSLIKLPRGWTNLEYSHSVHMKMDVELASKSALWCKGPGWWTKSNIVVNIVLQQSDSLRILTLLLLINFHRVTIILSCWLSMLQTTDKGPVLNALIKALVHRYPHPRYQPMDWCFKLSVWVNTHLPEWVFETLFT